MYKETIVWRKKLFIELNLQLLFLEKKDCFLPQPVKQASDETFWTPPLRAGRIDGYLYSFAFSKVF